MSTNYNQFYDADYYSSGCGTDYKDKDCWREVFEYKAKKIVEEFAPKTFLDVGCAFGYLVAALRDLGVEAYGIDVSEYAISQVREDIRPFCGVSTATNIRFPEGFPHKFDVLSTIEVVEHLYEEDADAFFDSICPLSDVILFSSSPDDIYEYTHFNVQQPEYWAKRFAKRGFYHAVGRNVDFISPDAVLFTKEDISIPRLVENYEHGWRGQELAFKKQIAALREGAEKEEKSSKELERLLPEKENLANQLYCTTQQLEQVRTEIHHLRQHNAQLEAAHKSVAGSLYWKMTFPLRKVGAVTKKVLRRTPGVRRVYSHLACIKDHGWAGAKEVRRHLRFMAENFPGTNLNVEDFVPLEVLKKQLANGITNGPKISLVVPLYNTPPDYLVQMLDSVLNQTYRNWELCLADASDGAHGDVGQMVAKYAGKYPNILYRKLETNEGISENTNEAMQMATGDFFALFDHDDLLHPSALYFVAKAIAEQGADFVYTDELTFDTVISNVTVTHLKPDFAIDTLRANNYICHLTTFSRKLYDQVGGFRGEYNGSQDYDMVLRLTEKAEKIVHIPHILYYWRTHATSVASDILAKPYCIDAAIGAIEAHLERCGLKGKVSLVRGTPGFYRVEYELTDTPLVSIIIPNMDHLEDLKRCIESVVTKTTYPHYEILVVENNSKKKETFAYYKEMVQNPKIRLLTYPKAFNFSAINNFAVKEAKGSQLVLLNNDTELITPNWLQEMLMFAQREDVGAVGVLLYYPNNQVQHAGVGLGIMGLAAHLHKDFWRGEPGYMGRLMYAQDLSAVTAACMMVSKELYNELGGFDESFAVAFNDVDFCMKIRQKNRLIVFTPFVQLFHHESVSRGNDADDDKYERFRSEMERFQQRWVKELREGDPYFNPNFDIGRYDFYMDIKPIQ